MFNFIRNIVARLQLVLIENQIERVEAEIILSGPNEYLYHELMMLLDQHDAVMLGMKA